MGYMFTMNLAVATQTSPRDDLRYRGNMHAIALQHDVRIQPVWSIAMGYNISAKAAGSNMKLSTFDRPTLLYPLNGGDWVGHYYHYLFGYLMPIVLHFPSRTEQIGVLSVGHLDHVTTDVFGDDIRILPLSTSDQRKIISSRKKISKTLRFLPFKKPIRKILVKSFLHSLLKDYDINGVIILDSYDNPLLYQTCRLKNFRSLVLDCLSSKLDQLKQGHSGNNVVLIERGEPGEQYLALGQTAGKQRRSIPNIKCLCNQLSKCCNVGKYKLEEMTFPAQVALFSEADVIVAQHGAALSNIVWMRPDSLVLEVIPAQQAQGKSQSEFFSSLAAAMGVQHRYIFQHDNHASLTKDQMAEIETAILHYLANDASRVRNG